MYKCSHCAENRARKKIERNNSKTTVVAAHRADVLSQLPVFVQEQFAFVLSHRAGLSLEMVDMMIGEGNAQSQQCLRRQGGSPRSRPLLNSMIFTVLRPSPP